jgi:hypothetical protein
LFRLTRSTKFFEASIMARPTVVTVAAMVFAGIRPVAVPRELQDNYLFNYLLNYRRRAKTIGMNDTGAEARKKYTG